MLVSSTAFSPHGNGESGILRGSRIDRLKKSLLQLKQDGLFKSGVMTDRYPAQSDWPFVYLLPRSSERTVMP